MTVGGFCVGVSVKVREQVSGIGSLFESCTMEVPGI